MGVHQLYVLRRDTDLSVFKIRADMVHMAVGVHKGHRQLCQLANKGFKAAHAGEPVYEQGPFAALDKIGLLPAKAGDKGHMPEYLARLEKF